MNNFIILFNKKLKFGYISATTTTTPRPLPIVKPICFKLLHFPILFKIAQHKHICPEYSYLYYPQHYGNSVPLRYQQQLSNDATVKPIKYRQSFPQPVFYRPTTVQIDENSRFTRRQNYEQAFNFRTTTAPPQVFNFRPSNQKYQRSTAAHPVHFSVKFTHAFSSISLNYPATPETPQDMELANVLQDYSEGDYPAMPIADPIVKLDFFRSAQ